MAEFMRYFLTDGVPLIAETGYVESTEETYQEGLALIP